MITITKELLERGKSDRGALNNKQVKALGIKQGFVNNPGWRNKLIGSQVTEQQYKRFLELKNSHLDKYGNNLFDQLKEGKKNLNHMNSIKEEIEQARNEQQKVTI